MTAFDAIIVGGGVNGLVAGAVLAKRGKAVCILEQAETPGGMALMREGDGPALAHLLYNLSPVVRREIGLDRHKWPFRQTVLPSVALDPDGGHLVMKDSDVRHADGSTYHYSGRAMALIAQLRRYGALLRLLAEGPPPGGGDGWLSSAGLRQMLRLSRFGLGLRGMGKAEMRRFLQILLHNAYDTILDEIPDGPLAGMLAADAVRGAAVGPRQPGTVFNLIYRMGHDGTITRPDSGMSAVIDTLAQAAQQAGCVLRTGQTVAQILVDDDRATGVRCADGQILHAPLILSSAAAAQTCQMAGIQFFDIETTRRLRNIRARGTTAKINLRLSARPKIPGLPDDLLSSRLVLAPSADYVDAACNPAKYNAMSDQPVIEAVMPDPDADQPWLSAIVQYAPSDLEGGWTDAARDKLLSHTLNALRTVMPDLPHVVTESQIVTPDRIESATGAPGGHWHHAEMNLDQLLTLRPINGMGRYATPLKGLYLCGAGTHPGGDVMGLAGRNAAMTALEAAK